MEPEVRMPSVATRFPRSRNVSRGRGSAECALGIEFSPQKECPREHFGGLEISALELQQKCSAKHDLKRSVRSGANHG